MQTQEDFDKEIRDNRDFSRFYFGRTELGIVLGNDELADVAANLATSDVGLRRYLVGLGSRYTTEREDRNRTILDALDTDDYDENGNYKPQKPTLTDKFRAGAIIMLKEQFGVEANDEGIVYVDGTIARSDLHPDAPQTLEM